MISVNYVNGDSMINPMNDLFREFHDYLNNSVDILLTEGIEMDLKFLEVIGEAEILDDYSSDSVREMYEGAEEFIKSIGDKVLMIYNKFIDLVDSVMNKIRSLSFKTKSNIQKVEALAKKNPNLADEIVGAYKTNELDLSDMKTLKEVDQAFDEILRLSKNKNEDPDSLKTRWKKKLASIDKSTAVKTIGAASAGISLLVAIRTYHSKVSDAKRRYEINKADSTKLKDAMYQRLKDADPDFVNKGKCQCLLAMYRELMNRHSYAIQQDSNVITRMSDKLAKVADDLLDSQKIKKIAGNQKSSFHANAAYNDMVSKNEKEKSYKIKEEESYYQKKGQLRAEDEHILDSIANEVKKRHALNTADYEDRHYKNIAAQELQDMKRDSDNRYLNRTIVNEIKKADAMAKHKLRNPDLYPQSQPKVSKNRR